MKKQGDGNGYRLFSLTSRRERFAPLSPCREKARVGNLRSEESDDTFTADACHNFFQVHLARNPKKRQEREP